MNILAQFEVHSRDTEDREIGCARRGVTFGSWIPSIVGNIDPRTLGRLIASMDEMPNLEQFMDVME